MPLISLLYILATSALICIIMVPFVSRLSVHTGILDRPDERKTHYQATPRLGGVAIFSALLFTIIFFCDIDQKIRGVLSGAILIFLTGLADDLTQLTPRQKFAGEFVAAALAVFVGGITVHHIGNPLGLGVIELGYASIPFTIIGIVGLINAINLLDGLDGLAGGVCIIICITFAIISYTSGNTILLALNIALLGSLLGFLRYNHYPAIIFMGDCGSLLLGYCMGVFSVMLADSNNTVQVSPYIPLLALGVPIIDTLAVMFNRRLSGKRLFSPDRTHLHHRLLNLGFSHRITVLLVYCMTYILSCVAVFGQNLNDIILLVTLLAGALLMYLIMVWAKKNRYNSQLASLNLKSRYFSRRLRMLVHHSMTMTTIIKYLLIAILLLPVLLSYNDAMSLRLVSLFILLASSGIFFISLSWSNLILQGCIYSSGVIMVFAMENYGRNEIYFNTPLHHISNAIFLIMLIFVIPKVMIRKRISIMVVSPFEYLIMLIILSVPLLPAQFISHFHLFTVAAKSIILCAAFKLVLMRHMQRNRKIILAIVISSLIFVVRGFLKL